jgi:branched-chain amino acid transport system substrate-binding protein
MGTPAQASERDREIIIGVCVDLSGPAKIVGSAHLRGLEDYIGLVNEEGGVFGRKLKVVFADSKFNVYPDGLRGVEKIMEQFRPRFLVVDSTHLMVKLLGFQVDQKNKKLVRTGVPLVGPGKKYEVLLTSGSMMNDFAQEQIHPSVFVTGPTYGDQLRMLLRYAAREKKRAKVAFFYSGDTPYGYLPMSYAAHECRKLGLRVMGEVTAPFGAGPDDEALGRAVKKIKQWGPDYVIINGFAGRPIPEFIKQCSENGVKSVFLATVLAMHEHILEMLKTVSSGYVYMGVSPFNYWTMKGPMIEKLKNFRRKKWPETHPNQEYLEEKDHQSIYYILGAVEGMVLVEAAKRAYKQAGGMEPAFGQLIEGLRSIRDLPTGGLTHEPLTLKNNSFQVGRIFKADTTGAVFVPVPRTSWGDFFLR